MAEQLWTRGLRPPPSSGEVPYYLARLPAGVVHVICLCRAEVLSEYGAGPFVVVRMCGSRSRIYRLQEGHYTRGPTGDDPAHWQEWEVYPIDDVLALPVRVDRPPEPPCSAGSDEGAAPAAPGEE